MGEVDLLRRAPVWRDYPAILAGHGLDVEKPLACESPEGAKRRAVEILWGALRETGVSWIGFYDKVPGAQEMVLVCREPKPACSPIGLHGMCGRCWQERAPVVVKDVRTLGDGYIACDPKDLSEVVVPLLTSEGECDSVLDVDSHEAGAFDTHDAQGLTKVLVALGLTTPGALGLKALVL